MKRTILLLTLTFLAFTLKAEEKITATVVFENLTNKEQVVGEFFITETNETIKVSGTNSFKITLPEKGKYQFGFLTSDFDAYTYYPAKITHKKNTITIRLVEKKHLTLNNGMRSFPIDVDTKLTDKQIEKKIADGNLNFIIHGIDSSIPKEYVDFKEKYGIGLIKKNCIIDPLSFKIAIENNQMISDYLNSKYGEEWRKELTSKPLGVN